MIKGWYAKHKDTGEWHKIEDVKDTGIPADKEGGGNNYHLKGVGPVHQSKIADMAEKPPMEKADKLKGGLADDSKPSEFDAKQLEMGIRHEMEHTDDKSVAKEIAMDHLKEDPEYYTKLKDIDKYDRVDEEADGKKELDYGVEELDKRWNKLKKALVDSDSAIMEIAGQEYNPDEEEEAQDEQEGDIDEPVEGDGSGDGDGGELQGDGSDVPDELDDAQGMLADDEFDSGEQDGDPGDDQQALIQMLQEEGYSEAEIAHIVHDHNMPTPNIDDVKMDGEHAKIQQDTEHADRMNDLDHEHTSRMKDLEYETAQQEQGINELDKDHKQRMLDLEFEYAKQEKDMEMEFKRKELEQKLQFKEESHKAKKADANKSRSQDAAKTSNKEKAGK
jgi:uncharacterized coiled-coil protein SlyX